MSIQKKTVWLLADGRNIGGAESRMVKVAARIADEDKIKKVNLMVTPELKAAYLNHAPLKHLLAHPKIHFVLVEKKVSLIMSFLRRVFLMLGFHIKGFEKLWLIQSSWLIHLRQKVSETDIIHCYMGDNARNGAFLFSREVPNRVIIEITNNRYLEGVSASFKLLSMEAELHENCVFVSVSQKVYRNWNRNYPADWFRKRNIMNICYQGSFIDNKKETDSVKKENIIIFPHRFVGPKNGVLFSEVIAELFEEGHLDGWKVLFRGKGMEEQQIRKNIQKWTEKGQADVGYSQKLYDELKKSKISVSLIETGSYPSQSVFESMQAGCALLISRSGNSEKELNHPAIYFTDLNKEEIKKKLVTLVDKNNDELKNIQQEMVKYYQWFIEYRNQMKEILNLYELNN